MNDPGSPSTELRQQLPRPFTSSITEASPPGVPFTQDSEGQNLYFPGVYHACMHAQMCLPLCNPMDCSPSGSSVHGIFRQEYCSGSPFPPPGDLPDSGIEPASPSWKGRFFTTEPAEEHKSLP